MLVERQSDYVLRLIRSAQEVEDSVTVQAPKIAPLLEERLAPRFANLGGVKGIFLATMYALRDDLADSRVRLSSDEKSHLEVLRKITQLSHDREQLFEKTQKDFTGARGAMEDLYGSGAAYRVFGVQGPSSPGTDKLLRQIEVAVDRLSDPDLDLPEPRLDVLQLDPQALADQLRTRGTRLSEIVTELRQLKREAQVTRKIKNRTLREHKKTFLATSRTIEGFYRLAGEDELADRVRPSIQRPGRRAVDEKGSPDGGSQDGESPDQGSPDAGSKASEETAGEPSAEKRPVTDSRVTASSAPAASADGASADSGSTRGSEQRAS